MYFKNFPLINYSLDGGITSFTMTDIFRRVKADGDNILTSTAYDEYDIQDGDTPEVVAHRIYGDTTLHWIILITNEIIDPRYDWPLSTYALNQYIADKYGANNVFATKHFENSDGDVVHSSFAGVKFDISNYVYEERINESKRRIKILKPEFVSVYVERFTGLLNNG